jgi:glucosyl-3-phosphoglycerate synthase
MRPTHVLLPACDMAEAAALLPIARAIALGWKTQVLLFGIVQLPPTSSLDEGALLAQTLRQELERLAAADPLVEMLPTIKVTHTPWNEIGQQVKQADSDLLLLCWRDDQSAFGADLRDVLVHPPCDVAIVRPGEPAEIRRILLPVRGGPHSELALRISLALAEAHLAEITALHIAPPAPESSQDAPFTDLMPVLQQLPPVTRIVTLQRQIQAAILSETHQHDLIVMGATARPRTELVAIGEVAARVFRALDPRKTAIAVKTHREMVLPEPAADQPTAAPAGHKAISILLDKWLAENTCHHREFADLDRLLELKRTQRATISLGLLTLNNEQTIRNIVTILREALLERVPLLDEIVLVDSNSTDQTREIARQLGVPVYVHSDILLSYGAFRGKGEAMWKSLYVLRGDILVWLDAGAADTQPSSVYGLLGALLRESRIHYVQGFGGGPDRAVDDPCAEWLARPVLNLFYPELSGLMEPLSCERAARRTAVERLPFFAGEGVEIGLAIDMFSTFGLQAIAQCDLGERTCTSLKSQPADKTPYQILQVLLKRLGHDSKLADVNKTIKHLQYQQGRFFVSIDDVREYERPPMIRLPEYRRQRELGEAMV